MVLVVGCCTSGAGLCCAGTLAAQNERSTTRLVTTPSCTRPAPQTPWPSRTSDPPLLHLWPHLASPPG
ncbi:hypothetical protein BCR44DRAFT_1431394 [Catenaria anguillulae PL171]|uniref:Secreted protein n=1 Tax=Catenaria anguillulae PL171 TaxID=765915 RepID=A0A1Y2HTG4_9FUNG|nr:hypothetical protein BCR44DRAFT_1431394 [Catenaria anguillulae PL171]